MKQMKKIHFGWKLVSILPMAGVLVAALGLAAPAFAGPNKINPTKLKFKGHITPQRRPDLRVRVWVDKRSVHQNADHTYNFTLRGELKNVGKADYKSRRNQQVLFLHEVGKSHHITDWHFSRLNHGQVKNVHVPIKNHPGGEFVPAYELALSFDPDIYMDKNPANDDRNRRNNQATVSSKTISTAFARASSGVRGVHIAPVGVRLGKPSLKVQQQSLKVREQCPQLGVVSFKIVGTVPVTGKGGDRSYRLRLPGVVQNFGDSYRGPIGEVKILERMPGAQGKFISHQRPHNLAHSKQLMIGALTQPFALSTEFLPDYDLLAYTDVQHKHKSCKIKNGRVRRSARITSQKVRDALQH